MAWCFPFLAERARQLEAIDLCPELRATLDAALADDCPLASNEGGFIREGFSDDLDALRELAHGGKQWIARYQAQEIERAGIPTLKVGFNKVFGYYIEITNAHREKIPPITSASRRSRTPSVTSRRS